MRPEMHPPVTDQRAIGNEVPQDTYPRDLFSYSSLVGDDCWELVLLAAGGSWSLVVASLASPREVHHRHRMARVRNASLDRVEQRAEG